MAPRKQQAERFAVPAEARVDQAERVTEDVVVVELPAEQDGSPHREDVDGLGVSWVAPVVADTFGEESYPTGEVTVRFEREPTDQELRKFAADHELEVARRNEFVASQIVFVTRTGAGVYLPAKRDQLREEPNVSEVWLNTVSRYRRSTKTGRAPAEADAGDA